MSEDRVIKKLYKNLKEEGVLAGPKCDGLMTWRKMRISGWRGKVRRRDEWKSVLREVKVLQGP
jgi:hypothetical protein